MNISRVGGTVFLAVIQEIETDCTKCIEQKGNYVEFFFLQGQVLIIQPSNFIATIANGDVEVTKIIQEQVEIKPSHQTFNVDILNKKQIISNNDKNKSRKKYSAVIEKSHKMFIDLSVKVQQSPEKLNL